MSQLPWIILSLVLLPCGWFAAAWHYQRRLHATQLQLHAARQTAAEHAQTARWQIGQLQAELAPFWRRYLDAMLQLEKRDAEPSPELLDYRWMIEELRVSLFAQELKTIQPISTKRLEKQWESTIRQVSPHH